MHRETSTVGSVVIDTLVNSDADRWSGKFLHAKLKSELELEFPPTVVVSGNDVSVGGESFRRRFILLWVNPLSIDK